MENLVEATTDSGLAVAAAMRGTGAWEVCEVVIPEGTPSYLLVRRILFA